MKVLRVINSLGIGGAERSIVSNVPLHIQNGFDMDVVLLNGSDSFFKQEIIQQGVKIISLGNNIYNPFLIFKIIKIIKQYDIIHGHLFPTLYWIALAKLVSFSNKKFIYTEHATENRRRKKWYWKFMDRLIYRQYDYIISISDETDKNLQKHLNFYYNKQTIYNGVDLKKVREEAEVELPELKNKLKDKKVIIQVAGFRIEKDQDTLIRALKELPSNCVILFVGDGPRLQECKELAIKLGVVERIFFSGLQSQIGAYIQLADIAVMSSHWEGFGRAAIECMALGKPLIASNVAGLSKVVGGFGLLFEKGNEKELVSQILQLLNDSEFYRVVAQKCLKRSEEFQIEKMIKAYEEVYKTVIRK